MNSTGFHSVPIGHLVTTPLTGLDQLAINPQEDYIISPTLSLITLIISSFVYGLGFLAVLYAWWFRNYAPLKAKHIPLLTLAHVANTFWWIGFMHGYGFFGFDTFLMQQCAVWDVWMQFIFGIMLLTFVYNFRLFSLYKVFVKRQSVSATLSHFILPAMVLVLPTLALGVISLVVPQWSIMNVAGSCRMHLAFKISIYTLAFCALIMLGWLTFALRNIRRSFNEFTELRTGFYVAVVAIMVNSIIVITQSYNTATMIALIIANLVCGNLYFWIVIWRPLFGHMFAREATLRRFIMDLDLDGVKNASVNMSRHEKHRISSNEKSGMPALHISAPITPDDHFLHQLKGNISHANSSNPSVSKIGHSSSIHNSYYSDIDAMVTAPPLAYADPRRGTIFPSTGSPTTSRASSRSSSSSSGSDASYDEEDELMMYRHGGGPMVIGWENYGNLEQRLQEMSGYWGEELISYGSSRSSSPNSGFHDGI